jgi:hypothetical protein
LTTAIPQYAVGPAAATNDNFIANTVYEPNAAPGVVCSNYTALYGLYEQSVVRASKIELQITNTSTTVPMIAVLFPCGVATAPGSYAIARAQRLAKALTIAPATAGPNTKTLTSTVDFQSFFGLSNLSAATSGYAALSGVHPALLLYWQICFYSSDGVSGASADICATLTSKVDFFGFPLAGL